MCWQNFDRPLDPRAGLRTGITERKLNLLLPFCYPTWWWRTILADLRWTGVAKLPKGNSILQSGPLRADMAESAFRVRCIRPLSNSRNAGADQIVRRPASPRSAFAGRGGGFVFMADHAKIDIPYR
jgi:hypothetical protein